MRIHARAVTAGAAGTGAAAGAAVAGVGAAMLGVGAGSDAGAVAFALVAMTSASENAADTERITSRDSLGSTAKTES
jgi:hypothetical protein